MKILFVPGSLRKNSLNRQLAEQAANLLGDYADTQILDYQDVPLFNQDEEFPVPQAVERVRAQFLEADAIWFFTPAYNMQIPGVLKNLLDWMSRPTAQSADFRQTALFGKTAAISGIGGKNKTANVRILLRDLLKFCGMNVIEDSFGFAATPQEFAGAPLVITEEIEKDLRLEAKNLEEVLDQQ